MNNFQIIIVGWLVGQFGYAAVSIWIIQRNLKNVTYFPAAWEYIKKEFGGFVVAFAALLILLFILPDWWDVTIKKADLASKETLSLKEKLIYASRTVATVVGGLSQHLLYMAYKKGKKGIHDLEVKNQLLDSDPKNS